MAVNTNGVERPTAPPLVVSTHLERLFALSEIRWAASALFLFTVGLGVELRGAPTNVWFVLYLACCVAGGWRPGLTGLRALRNGALDVDLLMVVATIGAIAIGQITDGALLIVIFSTAAALEALATAHTEDSVRGLLDLAPDTATRVSTDPEETVRAVDLCVGDLIMVRPGERIAADATVVSGRSKVNQATITGEPLPVSKAGGDQVFAGTLNGTGALQIRVDRCAQDSVVARIAALVEQASRTKASTQLFIEKVGQRYSVGMVVITLAVFAVPLMAGDGLQRALLRAMTFMIVASPCALVLATMPPLLAAVANAGRHGVLVKSAAVMERLGTTSAIAFDKTGTLTRGVPQLAEIHCLDSKLSKDKLLQWAGAVEQSSEHPLATAIVRAARTRDLGLATAEEFAAHPGRGVTARVGDRTIGVESPTAALARLNNSHESAELSEAVKALQSHGNTAVVVTRDRQPVGVLGIMDQLRPEAVNVVGAARALTGEAPVLLTGDDEATAHLLASQLGITDVRARLLPDDKVAAVRQLQASGHNVTMVGDGINDAPALAVARVGIAMGGAGSDMTLQTADAVVVRDDLTAITAVIALSRSAIRVVIANLVIAAMFITVLVAWDLVATLPLPLGIAGHEGSTLIVGLNGLRLLRKSAWKNALSTTVTRPACTAPSAVPLDTDTAPALDTNRRSRFADLMDESIAPRHSGHSGCLHDLHHIGADAIIKGRPTGTAATSLLTT